MQIISINNLNKSINNQSILKDVNLSVNKGEICALIGPNGAGKTTLIKCLLHLINPDSGTIKIKGQSITAKDWNSVLPKFGVVLKYPERISKLTIDEIFKQHSYYMGFHQTKSINQLLNYVGLFINVKTKIGQLSLGMKQRLLLALAISHNPSVIILDEPFNGLDIDGADQLEKSLKKLRNSGKSILITSHTLERLNNLANSIIFINDGKTKPKKQTKEIKQQYGNLNNYYRKVNHE